MIVSGDVEQPLAVQEPSWQGLLGMHIASHSCLTASCLHGIRGMAFSALRSLGLNSRSERFSEITRRASLCSSATGSSSREPSQQEGSHSSVPGCRGWKLGGQSAAAAARSWFIINTHLYNTNHDVL